MVGVSKWPYDQYNIDRRQQDCDHYGDPSDNCKNEAWFMRELSWQFRNKFEVERNLRFAFMESFSQSGPNLNDEVQQRYWIKETNKLWSEATSRNKTFDFKTIDEVLEENAVCKEENKRLNDIICEDIKHLKDYVTTLNKKINWNEEKITLVQDDVAANQDYVDMVQGDVAVIQADVASNQGDFAVIRKAVAAVQDDVVALEESIERNSADISTLATMGHWCAAQTDGNWKRGGTITYNKLIFSASYNMNIAGTPLDINTGINF